MKFLEKVWVGIATFLGYVSVVSLVILMAALPLTALLATLKWFLSVIGVI